jgi:hypothetical protein
MYSTPNYWGFGFFLSSGVFITLDYVKIQKASKKKKGISSDFLLLRLISFLFRISILIWTISTTAFLDLPQFIYANAAIVSFQILSQTLSINHIFSTLYNLATENVQK